MAGSNKVIYVNGVRLLVSKETYEQHLKEESKKMFDDLCKRLKEERKNGQTIF